jgi:hypothetical protein
LLSSASLRYGAVSIGRIQRGSFMGKYRKAFRCVVPVVGCVLFVVGCSKTATIYLKDGGVVEGKIISSDYSSIRVAPVKASYETEAVKRKTRPPWAPEIMEGHTSSRPAPENEVRIVRSNIKDIDHPGNVVASIAGALSILGIAVSIAVYLPLRECEADPDVDKNCLGEALLAGFVGIPSIVISGISLIPTIWGIITWSGSSSTAAPPEESEGPKITPVALTDGERTYWGLGMSWSW